MIPTIVGMANAPSRHEQQKQIYISRNKQLNEKSVLCYVFVQGFFFLSGEFTLLVTIRL